MNLEKTAVIVIIVAGVVLIATAFISSPVQIQIASGLVGLGFICLGIIQVKNARYAKQNEENHRQIMEKLEEIKQELEKKEQPRGGVAIADILGAGLKYYTEHMSQPKGEEEKKDD